MVKQAMYWPRELKVLEIGKQQPSRLRMLPIGSDPQVEFPLLTARERDLDSLSWFVGGGNYIVAEDGFDVH